MSLKAGALSALVLLTAFTPPKGTWATVKAGSGKLEKRRPDGTWEPFKARAVGAYASLRTPAGSNATFELPGKASVKLTSGSSLQFAPAVGEVVLSGAAFLDAPAGAHLVLQTLDDDRAEVGPGGARFCAVWRNEEAETRLVVRILSGEVKVQGAPRRSSSRAVTVRAGEEVQVPMGSDPLDAHQAAKACDPKAPGTL